MEISLQLKVFVKNDLRHLMFSGLLGVVIDR